jgi:hypothetical protein
MRDKNRKSVKDMTQREQRQRRKVWRTAQRNKRQRDKDNLNRLPVTPPDSPPHHLQENFERRAESMRKLGRKKKRKDRAKAYRTIEKLQIFHFNQKKLVNKWKKKRERLKQGSKSDCENKVEEIIERGEAKKALLLYESILQKIRRRYQSSTNKEKKGHTMPSLCPQDITTLSDWGVCQTVNRYSLKEQQSTHKMCQEDP